MTRSAAVLAASTAAAQNGAPSTPTACIQQPVAFDGIAPLSYATVTGAAESKAYLYAHFPEQCATDTQGSCESSTYVLSGDVVAVGKNCGAWAYVQYIGEKRVTTGWLARRNLAPVKKTSTLSPSPKGDDTSATVRGYSFKLTRGRGRPVCEAYLQRLNSTPYATPPFCGRPENDSVPGFVALTRAPLTATQVEYWYPRVLAFREYQRQATVVPPAWPVPEKLIPLLGTQLFAWRYVTPLDIENDGKPIDVLIWQGPGVDPEVFGSCGSENSVRDQTVVERLHQLAFALDDGRIDESRTKAVFGHPSGGYYATTGAAAERHELLSQRFRPIGEWLGFFRYRDTYYMDTFLDPSWGDLDGKRVGSSSLKNTLAVVQRRDGQMSEVCEYNMTVLGGDESN